MIPSSPALTSAVLISRGSIQAVLFFLVFSLFQSHQSKFLAHHAVLTMGISTEAIIAIIALFIAIPPIIFKVQQWIHQKQQITELPAPAVSAQPPWRPDPNALSELSALTPRNGDQNGREWYSTTHETYDLRYTRVTSDHSRSTR
ncbi:hypothetical protein JMJ77_0006342 [Colletotrichum scovillei]|uniref:Uncharacterized protein n=1 Tax=Colletotrichum scovillei TaxID=1209932 RepID=A0A9P7UL37_9PEZI|nr:hypothetical protein JMJ77_0006342 [Colletotrichum scovillei]KAG7077543.1 hypothetical protein JMJ76_0014789 [Colletotrichum scovillei]KAG7084789.1 hypothetical protein JMJ78_0010221 [Colletotrichum scovillei]